ncbi:MAG: hypothetical protein ACJ71T_12100 [Actinomycetales bacterium]
MDEWSESLPDDPFIDVAAYDQDGIAVHLHTLPGAEHAVVEAAGLVTRTALWAALETVPDGMPIQVGWDDPCEPTTDVGHVAAYEW